MPQMSPLLWGNLFIAFTVLLVFSSVKIYFSDAKKIKMKEAEESNELMTKKINWMW